MEKQKIVVTGATGNIGFPVVAGLVERGYQPRVIVRKKQAIAEWEKAGIEQIVADANDTDSLAQAFAGAEKLFSLTPLVQNFLELTEKTVEAAKRAGVQAIVRSSAQGASVDAPIVMGRWHGEAEQMFETAGFECTFVQPASFFQNYLGYADSIKNQNAFYLPMGEGKVSLVDVRDIAAVVVAALTESGHAGKRYAVTGGESLSGADIADIFSDVLGRRISYIDVPEETANQQMTDAGMPNWLVKMVAELSSIGKAGYLAEVKPTVEQVTGQRPRTFRAFAEENRNVFI